MQTLETYGWVDHFDGIRVKGWLATQRETQQIEVLVNSNVVGRYSCDVDRPDIHSSLPDKLSGSGFNVPLVVKEPALVDVRCANTGTSLNGSPFLFAPSTFVSLSTLDAIKRFSEHLEYDADALLALVVGSDIVRNQERLAEIKGTAQVSPVYSCKKKLTGLIWFFPKLGKKYVQLNKRLNDCARIQKLHHCILEQGSLGHILNIPQLLGLISLQRSESQNQLMQALIYQYIEPVQKIVPDDKDDSVAMIRSLLELNQLNDHRAQRSHAFKLFQRLRDLVRVFTKRERLSEKISTLRLLVRYWRLPLVFSHGDAHRENFLIEQHSGDLYLVDWSHYGHLPLGFDIAWLIKHQDIHSAVSLIRKALRDYDPLDSERIQSAVLLNVFYLMHLRRQGPLRHQQELKKLLVSMN